MFILARTTTYASLFTALLLVFVPARILERAGISVPDSIGAVEAVGGVMVLLGAGLGVACVFTFALIGKGTPAPFDPPRRLVIRGPYKFVRNPMYLGAVVALLGAALVYGSTGLLAYATVFFVLAHVLVVLYEEPTLRRTFGTEYGAYVQQVRRWLPRLQRNQLP